LLTLPQISRFRLSREVRERLNWRRANGQLKDMSCRVAMLRMQADGLITLPPPRNAKPVSYRQYPDIEHAVLEPRSIPTTNLARLRVDLVSDKRDSLLWNAYIQRYHYLGHQLMPGAQLRYFVRTEGHVIAALGFGASAWKVKPRDNTIGWTSAQRRRNLHLIVNNARFLILPWINCKNLASRVLALTSRRLTEDWHTRYAYRPVLLETFVEKPRFAGTCTKPPTGSISVTRKAAVNSTHCIATHSPSKASGFIHLRGTSSGISATDRSAMALPIVVIIVSLQRCV